MDGAFLGSTSGKCFHECKRKGGCEEGCVDKKAHTCMQCVYGGCVHEQVCVQVFIGVCTGEVCTGVYRCVYRGDVYKKCVQVYVQVICV